MTGDKKISQLGEFGLIAEIQKWVGRDNRVRIGIGDDAAVLSPVPGQTVFTADMLIEGRHFRRSEATPAQIGRKAMNVNVSDCAAMGAEPLYAVVSLGIGPDERVGFVRELYKGLIGAARQAGVRIVGGDTNRSDKLIVSVALTGRAPRGGCVLRSTARPGDVVFVTGALGGSYASRKHLDFTPRLAEARYLLKHHRPTSMMDISDGLASDLERLARASGVGAYIAYDSVPVSPTARDMRRALCEGEDFELLFTLRARDAARLSMDPPKRLARFQPIGKIVPAKYGLKLVRVDGAREDFPGKGFDHFA